MKRALDLHLRANYDRRADRITLVADRETHPDLANANFHVFLKPGTASEQLLRDAMVQHGQITLDAAGQPLGTQLEDLLPKVQAELVRLLLDGGRNLLILGQSATGKSALLDACLNHVQAVTHRPIILSATTPQEHSLHVGEIVSIIDTEGQRLDPAASIERGITRPGNTTRTPIYAQDEVDTRPTLWDETIRARLASLTTRGVTTYLTVHGTPNSNLLTNAAYQGLPLVFATTRDEAGGYILEIYHNGQRIG